MAGGEPERGVGRVDHVGLPVTDLDAASRFFMSSLGARLVFRLDRPEPGVRSGAERLGENPGDQFSLVMLELDGARLELVQWWRERPLNESAAALPGAHLALEVADVAAAVRALSAVDGVSVLGGPVTFAKGPTPGLTNAFLRISGGILIEIVKWA